MLVLSRKKNETIKIGGNITISVVEIMSDKVRIGIEAPIGISVWRGELYDLVVENEGPIPSLAPVDESCETNTP